MAIMQETTKPSVHVRYTAGAPKETLRQLLYGIEEEGIPWEEQTAEGSALELAWDASRSSRLEVGIGLDSEELILHFAKLERTQPLFRIPARSGEELVRALGSNAARLVKKLPLKVIDRR